MGRRRILAAALMAMAFCQTADATEAAIVRKTGISRRQRLVRISTRAAVVLLQLLIQGLASPVSAAEVWQTGVVRAVYPMADGSFALAFMTDSTACTASAPKYHYVTVGQNNVTAEASRKFYAAALSAYLTGAPLSIVFSDTTSMCYVNRVYLGT